MFSEWLTKMDDTPLVQRVRKDFAEGLYDDDAEDSGGGDLEDLSAVKWEAPSDRSEEEVLSEIEQFQQAMAANVHQVVSEDGGGEWL